MKVINIFWFLSILIAVGASVVANIFLPSPIGISSMPADFFISKNAIFYGSIVFLIGVNLLFQFWFSIFHQLPKGFVLVLNKSYWWKNEDTRKQLFHNLKAWLRSFSVLFNLFIAYSFGALYNLSQNDDRLDLRFLLIFLGALFAIWVLSFFVFTKKPKM